MANTATTMHRDPVCGMAVDESKAAGSSEYQGEKYYFCGPSCLAKFKTDPARYLQRSESATPKPPAENPKQVEYTCPMHPESAKWGQAPALSAEWHLSRSRHPPRRRTTPN